VIDDLTQGTSLAASTRMAIPTTHDTHAVRSQTPSAERRDTSVAPDQTQQVVMLTRFGGTDGFELIDQAMPTVGPGEVRVRVLAASVQFTDVIVRKGKYPGLHEKPPMVLGYDVVGEVDELGPGVTSFAVGDRVADLTVTGSYARYRTLRADRLVRVPQTVDPAEAAALVLSWSTAHQLLHRVAKVVEGNRVLVLGAAGAVGQALLTLGRLAGLQMWGSARATDAELIRSLGATPIDYETEDARTVVPEGFDVVLDGIGARGFAGSWTCVSTGGVLAAYGFSAAVKSGAPAWKMGWWLLRLRIWNWFPNGKRARFYSITSVRKRHPDWFRADLDRLFELLAANTIHPQIADRIALDQVPDAHRLIEAGGLTGKIMICP